MAISLAEIMPWLGLGTRGKGRAADEQIQGVVAETRSASRQSVSPTFLGERLGTEKTNEEARADHTMYLLGEQKNSH